MQRFKKGNELQGITGRMMRGFVSRVGSEGCENRKSSRLEETNREDPFT